MYFILYFFIKESPNRLNSISIFFGVQTKRPTKTTPPGGWVSWRIGFWTLLKKQAYCQQRHFKGTIPSSVLSEVVVVPTTSYNGNGSHSERDVQARVYRSGKNGGEHRQRSGPIRCVASFPYPYVPLQPPPPQRLRILRRHRPPPQRRRIIHSLPSPLSVSFSFLLLDWNSIPIFSC